MPTISEADVNKVLTAGNGGNAVIPASGGGFVKLSYLWGKLRVDRCDEAGKILAPERRGGGGDSTSTTVP